LGIAGYFWENRLALFFIEKKLLPAWKKIWLKINTIWKQAKKIWATSIPSTNLFQNPEKKSVCRRQFFPKAFFP